MLAVAACAGMSIASCTADKDLFDPTIVEQNVKSDFESNFTKNFGNVAPTQNWMGEVSFYEGSYDFDYAELVAKVRDLRLQQIGQGLSTRNVTPRNSDYFKVSLATEEDGKLDGEDVYRYMSYEKLSDIAKNLLPQYRNGGNTGPTANNKQKIHSNFEFYARETTSFYIYPLYWLCGSQYVGLYYVDENGGVHNMPLTGDVDLTKPENQPFFNRVNSTIMGSHDNQTWKELGYKEGDLRYPADQNWEFMSYIMEDDFDSPKAPEYYRSQAYRVTIPANTTFGLYLYNTPNTQAHVIDKDANGNVIFTDKKLANKGTGINGVWSSMPSLNDDLADMLGVSRNKEVSPNPGMGTFRYGDTTYFTVECGANQTYNDFFFEISPRPLIVDYDEEEFRFMCEDLGDTDDFDYNDLVFDVKHLVGTNLAELTVQAAGGTLPMSLSYNGNVLVENIHAGFGAANGQMINTGAGVTKDPYTVTFEVPKNFFFTTHANLFTVDVKYKDGVTENTISIPLQPGRVPQAFITNTKLPWCSERANIKNVYPSFTNWVTDNLKACWYETDFNLPEATE